MTAPPVPDSSRTAWRSCSAVSTRRTARPAVPYDAFTQCGYGVCAGRSSHRHQCGWGMPSSSQSIANPTLPATRSNASIGATATGASGGSRCRPAANNHACSCVASKASYSPAEHSSDTSDR